MSSWTQRRSLHGEKLAICEAAIEGGIANRDQFDTSSSGKEYNRLKGVIYRRKKALTELGELTSTPASLTAQDTSVDALLEELEAYVANEEVGDDDLDDDGDEEDGTGGDMNSNSMSSRSSNNNTNSGKATAPSRSPKIQERVEKYKKELADAKKLLKPFQQKRDAFAKKVKKGRALLGRLKKKLTKFRSTRKKSKDGIEAKFLRVLKTINVELTRYHGGSFTGVDIKKIIANASYVFDEFTTILKANNRTGNWNDTQIEELCEQHKRLFLLWDGAFSAARTINPTEEDFIMYSRFVRAAVKCHVEVGCSVTHKVHLMVSHVLTQMRTIPGGLGKKMEDWVELQHQSGKRARMRWRTTRDLAIRANGRARAAQRGLNAEVIAQREGIAERAKRNFKEGEDDKVSVELQRKAEREARRIAELEKFEAEWKLTISRSVAARKLTIWARGIVQRH